MSKPVTKRAVYTDFASEKQEKCNTFWDVSFISVHRMYNDIQESNYPKGEVIKFSNKLLKQSSDGLNKNKKSQIVYEIKAPGKWLFKSGSCLQVVLPLNKLLSSIFKDLLR